MPTDLRDRLRQLNIHKGAAHIVTKPKRKSHLESLIEGEIIETDYGPTFIHTERYAPDHVHGTRPIGDLLSLNGSIAARLAGLPSPGHEGEFARHLVHHVGRDAAHLLEVPLDHLAFLRAQAAEQAGGRMLSHGLDENGRFGRPG